MNGWVKCTSISCIVLLLLVLFIVLISTSVKVVENQEMALKYHSIARDFDRTQVPLEQGRYVLPPGQILFHFPRVYTLEKFEGEDGVSCVSRDGLALKLDVSFQFKIRNLELVDMFSQMGKEYEKIIKLQAKSAVRDACGNWTSTDFYFQRQAVQTDMGVRVDARLDKIFCEGGFLQLVNVNFDGRFMTAVQNNQAAIQDITQAENERAQSLIQANTLVLQAQKNYDITITNARAAAEAVLAQARAQARGINATINSQREAYLEIVQTLGLTGKNLINYIAIQTLQGSKSLTVNVESPAKFGFKAV